MSTHQCKYPLHRRLGGTTVSPGALEVKDSSHAPYRALGWTTENLGWSTVRFFSVALYPGQLGGPPSLVSNWHREIFSQGWSGQCLKLTTHDHLVFVHEDKCGVFQINLKFVHGTVLKETVPFLVLLMHSAKHCRFTVTSCTLCNFNPLTPELNPSAQRCMTRFFTGDFASWTVHFVNMCVKNQQIHQLVIHLIMYGSSYIFRHYIAIFRERS
jgi:hypothetical protein